RRLLWEAAFADQVEAPAEWRARLALSPPADAAWLAERIALADSNVGRSRLALLAFAQRLFGGAGAARRAADPPPAPRGFVRYRGRALTLGRMEIAAPAVHAAAERHAEQLEQAGRGERGRTSLAEFQGALALVERAFDAGTLDSRAASALVRSLAATRL